MPEDGNSAERDSLFREVEALRRNEKVVNVTHLRHHFGTDARHWVIITEYRSWADIEEGHRLFQEAIEKKWPDEQKRAAFFRRVNKYALTHSDEIFAGWPLLNQ